MKAASHGIVTQVFAHTVRVRAKQDVFNAQLAAGLRTAGVTVGDIVTLVWQDQRAQISGVVGHQAGGPLAAQHHMGALPVIAQVWWTSASATVNWSAIADLATYYELDATSALLLPTTSVAGYPVLCQSNQHRPTATTALWYRVRYVTGDGRVSAWLSWAGPWSTLSAAEQVVATYPDVWTPLPDGGYFAGDPIGATLELRRIRDLNANGTPYLDAGGEQQRRVMLAARGQNGMPGVVILSGTQSEPNTAALLLLAEPPANANAPGTKGEIRIATGYIYVCVADSAWERASLSDFASNSGFVGSWQTPDVVSQAIYVPAAYTMLYNNMSVPPGITVEVAGLLVDPGWS